MCDLLKIKNNIIYKVLEISKKNTSNEQIKI